jgi:shikimate kinase
VGADDYFAKTTTTPASTTSSLKTLVLIGGRGCGKSSVCRKVAVSDARFTLVSLDDAIACEAGMSIPKIVDHHGGAGCTS